MNMRHLFSILLMLLLVNTILGQNIVGKWNGLLKVSTTSQMRIVVDIEQDTSGYKATLYSPDQTSQGFAISTISFIHNQLKFSVSNLKIEYDAVLDNDSVFKGTFSQSGQKFPLNLTQKLVEKEVIVRKQDPQKPYPYNSEEVFFTNKKDNIILSGTLTLPQNETKNKAVILISGSGPQNRDEEIFGHKPFLIIADYLTRHNIAVLRFDDRGIGKSKGVFETATSLDFVNDVEAAFLYLKNRKEIDSTKIGLIGHSEGGMIAPMLASKYDDIAFVVLLAGPGQKCSQLLLLQSELINRSMGIDEKEIHNANKINKEIYNKVVKAKDVKKLRSELFIYMKDKFKNNSLIEKQMQNMPLEKYIQLQIAQITSPWFMYFIKYNPEIALKKLKCPVLALNGDKDLQVSAKENLSAIEKALKKGKNKNYKILILKNLNHLFQECKTGAISEYDSIEQTFSPSALKEIEQWIREQN